MDKPLEDFNFNSLFGIDSTQSNPDPQDTTQGYSNEDHPQDPQDTTQGYSNEDQPQDPQPDQDPDPDEDFFGLNTSLPHQEPNSVDPNSVESPTDFVDMTDDDDEMSFEQEGSEFANRYTEINEDLLGVKQGIPEGYPRIEFTIDDSVPMTNRELKSLQHFLLGYDHVELIEEKHLIRILLKIQTLSNVKSSYIGLISPKSLKTVLNNMKHHGIKAYFDADTELKGEDIYALYVPHS